MLGETSAQWTMEKPQDFKCRTEHRMEAPPSPEHDLGSTEQCGFAGYRRHASTRIKYRQIVSEGAPAALRSIASRRCFVI